MENEIIKQYTNGELTIVWKPAACIHSRNCWNAVTGMPQVFDPRKRPWITMENGPSSAEIAAQVRRCPSGALSTYYNAEAKNEAPAVKTDGLPGAAYRAPLPATDHPAPADSEPPAVTAHNAPADAKLAGVTDQNAPADAEPPGVTDHSAATHPAPLAATDRAAPGTTVPEPAVTLPDPAAIRIKVLPNGPLLVHGLCEVEDAAGNLVQKPDTTAFCRCGASSNKPYCDGSHSRSGFTG